MSPRCTPSQTVGPFFHIGLDWFPQGDAGKSLDGSTRITIAGRVLDGDGEPVGDALLEIWHADTRGCYPDTGATAAASGWPRGFGRSLTDAEGRFRFRASKPGPVAGDSGPLQAPHLVVMIFMRGLLKQLLTRIYFPDEPANVADPILALVDPARRASLIAAGGTDDPQLLSWDVCLQGERETVFFEC